MSSDTQTMAPSDHKPLALRFPASYSERMFLLGSGAMVAKS